VVLFALEVGRTLAGDLGREWEERSEDLRRAFAFSRFEKKLRKAGAIGGREEGRVLWVKMRMLGWADPTSLLTAAAMPALAPENTPTRPGPG
jgi:hypothetical protein